MIKQFFEKMFTNSRKGKEEVGGSAWDKLENTPNVIAHHVFIAREYYDQGYGRTKFAREYQSLEYIGATQDKAVVAQLAMEEQRYMQDKIVVFHGKLVDVEPVKEKYTEMIEKEKIVGFKVGGS